MHVAGRVNMDQTADAGDDENHYGRERVDQESHVDFQRAEIDPAIKIVDQKTLLGFEFRENEKGPDR